MTEQLFLQTAEMIAVVIETGKDDLETVVQAVPKLLRHFALADTDWSGLPNCKLAFLGILLIELDNNGAAVELVQEQFDDRSSAVEWLHSLDGESNSILWWTAIDG